MRLTIVPGRFAVCRLPADAPIPSSVAGTSLVSITRTSRSTASELSIVCPEAVATEGARTETGWRCVAVQGPIPFTATGILASVLVPLADAEVGIFAVSTFDTDYILLKEAQLDEAVAALKEAGHEFGD